jgi:predicted Fe-Mo cluster-binding NifX family protein
MRLALATWNGRVSPVFDASRHLLLIEAEDGRELSRQECEIGGENPLAKATWLAERGIEALVCGAVSLPLAETIAARGIRLVPFVAGGVDEVLAAFLAGKLPSPELAMPGCCGRRMRHGRGGGRGGGEGGRGQGCRRGRGGP